MQQGSHGRFIGRGERRGRDWSLGTRVAEEKEREKGREWEIREVDKAHLLEGNKHRGYS